eukprot:s528_g34.t1
MKDFLVKISAPKLLHYQSTHRAEKVSRAISKFAPRHNESDLTRAKSREGCASDLEIRTTPQRRRSDKPKVPRRFRERSQNLHRRATTKRSDACEVTKGLRERSQNSQREQFDARRVTRGLREQMSQNIARTTKNEH